MPKAVTKQYLRYLSGRFPNYRVELKSYNFTDWSYPSGIKYVDGRFIDLNSDMNYLFNTVMNLEEKTRYLQTKVSDAMTPWLAYGMISSAEEYNYDFDKEEEFDGEDDE